MKKFFLLVMVGFIWAPFTKAQDAILEAEQDIARNSRLKQQLELDLQRQKEAVNTARGLRRKN